MLDMSALFSFTIWLHIHLIYDSGLNHFCQDSVCMWLTLPCSFLIRILMNISLVLSLSLSLSWQRSCVAKQITPLWLDSSKTMGTEDNIICKIMCCIGCIWTQLLVLGLVFPLPWNRVPLYISLDHTICLTLSLVVHVARGSVIHGK